MHKFIYELPKIFRGTKYLNDIFTAIAQTSTSLELRNSHMKMSNDSEEERASELLKRLKTAVKERDLDSIEKYCHEAQSIAFLEESRCTSSRKRYNSIQLTHGLFGPGFYRFLG